MTELVLASAQTIVHLDTDSNIEDHIRIAKVAARYGVKLIAFPEMSITGYDRDNAREKAFYPNDKRLEPLIRVSDNFNIVIVAGAPIEIESDIYIGSFIIRPHAPLVIYVKQFLHNGEKDYYRSRADFNPHIFIHDKRAAFAICADIDNPIHVDNAAKDLCDLYVASIFFTSQSIDCAHTMLSEYARKHRLMMVMSNYAGSCWNLQAGAKSAILDSDGHLIQASTDFEECIVLASEHKGEWRGQTIQAR